MQKEPRPGDSPKTIHPVVNLGKFVRKHTQAVDVDTLNQQGINTVNFLTVSKLNDLISMAVRRAFEKYQLAYDQAEALRIQEEARGEVARSLERGSIPQPPAPSEKELLERRIEKLKRQVTEMETLLKEVSEAREAEAEVRESIFRHLPGLDPSDNHFEKKKGMLKVIFEDNLQLQKVGLV